VSGHRRQEDVLLGGRDPQGRGHLLVEWCCAVAVEDQPGAGQLVGCVVPRLDHGLVEVHRLVQERVLEPT
jgi:hypothetical protein